MRLAVGLTCWQDGNALIGAALASVASVADFVIVADGRVDGVEPAGLPDTSGYLGHVIRAAVHDTPVVFEARLWPSNSDKLTWLLDRARDAGAEWLLMLAADEELRHAHLLPGFLDGCVSAFSWPIPFYYHAKTRPEDASLCPSKLVRVSTWRRSVAGSNVLEAMDGTWYRVPEGCPADTLEDAWYLLAIERIPYLDHHPERRPEGRRDIRFVNYEMELEPLPNEGETELWPPMVLAPHPFLDGPRQSYRCDQCGRRYRNRGVCRFEHPSAELCAEMPDSVFYDLVGVDETQVANSEPVQGWYCDQCGKRFPLPGVCDGSPEGQHAETELKPLGPAAAVADESAAGEATETASEETDEPAAAVEAVAADGEQPDETTHDDAAATTEEAAAGGDEPAAADSEPASAADPFEQAVAALNTAVDGLRSVFSALTSHIEG